MQARVNVAASKRDTCIADLAVRDSTCTSPEELKFGMGSGFVSPTVLGPARPRDCYASGNAAICPRTQVRTKVSLFHRECVYADGIRPKIMAVTRRTADVRENWFDPES